MKPITCYKLIGIIVLMLGFSVANAQGKGGLTVASFPGGVNALYSYMAKNIHYPAQARIHKVEGKVFVSFMVEKDGSLTDVKVLHGIGSGCNEEAMRVIKASPRWIPGQENGKLVRQSYTLPVSFRLKS